MQTVKRTDLIDGTIGILVANAMMGEVTPRIVEAVAGSRAKKMPVPLPQESVEVVGVESVPLAHLIDGLMEIIVRFLPVPDVSERKK